MTRKTGFMAGHIMRRIVFIIGGARSGKSAFAEQLATKSFHALSDPDASLYYLATAQAFDKEMQARIDLHQQRRNADWQTIDVPVDLPEKLTTYSHDNAIILVDCLSIWATNLLLTNTDIAQARDKFIAAVKSSPAKIFIVSSETGLGIVPDTSLSRKFRDANGTNNQAIAELADEVYFMVAAIAQKIKP